MNERIREILTQCQQESIDGPEYPHWTDFEKFAKLIIRECANIVEGFTIEHEVALDHYEEYEASDVLKEHFGVEK